MSSEILESYLVEKYGILMKTEDLAEVLGQTAENLRKGLRSSSTANKKIADTFRPTMIKFGRRMYFKTVEVAVALSLTHDAT